MKFSFIQLSWW